MIAILMRIGVTSFPHCARLQLAITQRRLHKTSRATKINFAQEQSVDSFSFLGDGALGKSRHSTIKLQTMKVKTKLNSVFIIIEVVSECFFSFDMEIL